MNFMTAPNWLGLIQPVLERNLVFEIARPIPFDLQHGFDDRHRTAMPGWTLSITKVI